MLNENEIDSAIAKYNAKKERKIKQEKDKQKKHLGQLLEIKLFLNQVLEDEKVAELLTASDEEIYLHRDYKHYEPDIYIVERCGVLVLSNSNGDDLENVLQTLLQEVGNVEKVKEVFNAEIRRIIDSADSDE